MGKGIANPTAMILSAGMMLDWLGEQHDVEACRVGGRLLRDAVDRTYRSHAVRPVDQGGEDGTRAVAEAVVAALDAAEAAAR
jgi:3-isopropylmalate dehydrogenase